MKNLKKIFAGLVLGIALMFGLSGIKANAASSSQLTVHIYTYDEAGWNRWQNYFYWETDYYKSYYSTYKQNYDDYIADGETVQDAKEMATEEALENWNKKTAAYCAFLTKDLGSSGRKSCADFYGGTPEQVLASGVVDRNNYTCKEFTPINTVNGQPNKIYFEYVLECTDPMTGGNIGIPFYNIKDSGGHPITLATGSLSSYDVKYGSLCGVSSDTSLSEAKPVGASVKYLGAGFSPASDDVDVSTPRNLYAVGVTINPDANGQFTLKLSNDTYNQFNTAKGDYYMSSSAAAFRVKVNDDDQPITVGAGSVRTDLTLTVDGDTNTANYSSGTIAGITGISNDDINGSVTYSKIATSNTGNAAINATVAASGSVTGVRYMAVAAGGSYAALKTASVVTPGSTFNVPLSSLNTTNSIYVLIEATAQDGTTKGYTVLILQKEKNTTCELTSLTFNTGQLCVDGTKTPTTFSPTTLKYRLVVPDTVYQVMMTPDWDQTKQQKCYINGSGTEATRNTAVPCSTTSNITIRMVAEDGVHDQTYQITIYKASTTTTINQVSIKDSNNQVYTCTLDNNTNTYKCNTKLPYNNGSQSFTVVVTTPSNNSTISLDGRTLTSGNPSQSYSFPSTTAQTSATVQNLIVTSEAGTAGTTYSVYVEREGASTNNTLNDVYLTYASARVTPTSQTTDATGEVYNYTLNPGQSGFSFTAVVGDATQTLSCTVDGTNKTITSGTPVNVSFTGNGAQSFEIKITVKAQDNSTKTYTLKVTRRAIDDTYSFDATSGALFFDDDHSSVAYTGTNAAFVLSEVAYTNQHIYMEFKLDSNAPATTIIYQANGTPLQNSAGVYTYTHTFGSGTGAKNDVITFRIGTEASPVSGSSGGHTFTVTAKRKGADTQNTLDTTLIQLYDAQNAPVAPTSVSGTTYNYELLKSKGNYYTLDLQLKSNSPTNPSKAKIYASTSSSSAQYLNNPYNSGDHYTIGTLLYVFVVSESGAPNMYTFNVVYAYEKETNSTMQSIRLYTDVNYTQPVNPSDFTFNQSVDNYSFSVPYSQKTIYYKAQLDGAKAGFNYGSSVGLINLTNTAPNVNTLTIQAKAEDNSLGTLYNITITRDAAETDQLLTSLKINGTDVYASNTYNEYTNTIVWPIARNISAATLLFDVSNKASFSVTSNVNTTPEELSKTYQTNGITAGTIRTVTIKVISEYNKVENLVGNANVYTIYIIPAQQEFGLSDIRLYKDTTETDEIKDVNNQALSFASATQNYTMSVPYSVNQAQVVADKASNAQNCEVIYSPQFSSLTVNTAKKFTVTVKSELQKLLDSVGQGGSLGQSETYQISLTRQPADTENRLQSLSIKIAGTEYITSSNFNPNITSTIAIEGVTAGATQVDVTATPMSSLATIQAGSKVGSFNLTIKDAVQTFSIVVLAEDGSPRTYTYAITSGQIAWESDNNINNIELFASYDLTTNLLTSFSPSNAGPYSVSVKETATSVTFSISTSTPTSTVTINGSPVNSTSALKQMVCNLTSNTTSFEIICTSQNGTPSAMKYKVNVVKTQVSKDTSLSTFQIDGVNVVDGQTLNFDKDKTSVSVSATPTSNAATVLPYNDPQTLNPGTNLISVTVQAESGDTKTHTVTVIVDYPQTLSLLGAYKKDDTSYNNNLIQGFDPDTVQYAFTVPYEDDKLVITATPDGGSEVTVTGTGVQSLIVGPNTLRVKITAKSGDFKEYSILVTREAGSDDNYITKYEAEDTTIPASFASSSNSIDYLLLRSKGITVFNPTIEVSPSASYVIRETNRNLTAGAVNTFHIDVTSQTGHLNTYTVKVYVADEDLTFQVELLDQKDGTSVLDVNGDPFIYDPISSPNGTSITVPYSTSLAYLKVVPTSNYATAKVNNNPFTESVIQLSKVGAVANVYNIVVTSEYGRLNPSAPNATKTYELVINRNVADTDATLQELHVYDSETGAAIDLMKDENVFEPNKFNYFITNIGNLDKVKINAVPTVATSVVTGDLGVQALEAYNVESITGYVFTFSVICTAEDKSYCKYTVKLVRGAVDIDALKDDNTLNYITVKDSTGTEYITKATFDPLTKSYDVQIPYGVQSYSIEIDKPTQSPATPKGTGQFPVPADGKPVSREVYLESMSGKAGEKYTINFTFVTPSNDATLKSLTVDGTPVPGFQDTDNGGTYIIPVAVPNDKTSVDIAAIPNDPKAVVTGTGNVTLSVGLNTPVITVKAEDGTTAQYIIRITRDTEAPYLKDLKIEGEQLLDTNEKATQFVETTLSYKAIVPYTSLIVNINATVDNVTHTVTCSNATPVTTTGLVRTFSVNPQEGINKYTITVTSTAGKSTTYELQIRRRGLASMNANASVIEILEIPEFKQEYSNEVEEYEYTVDNSVRNLTVRVVTEKQPDANGDGATYKVYNDKNLKVGVNNLIIILTAEDKVTKKVITVEVTRKPNLFNILIDEIKSFSEDFKAGTMQAVYTVTNDIRSLNITVSNALTNQASEEPTYEIIGGDNLKTGENTVVISITAKDGQHYQYDVVVKREPNAYNIAIDEIPAYEEDFKKNDLKDFYEVPNYVQSIKVNVENAVDPDQTPAVEIIGNKNLKPGDNTVKVIVTAQDGEVNEYEIKVRRNGLTFSVDTEATGYKTTAVEGKENVYLVDLGSKPASTIEDYTSYIVIADEDKQHMTVDVLTENIDEKTNEVILRVSDGVDSKLVTFQIKTTANQSSYNWIVWVVLGVAVLILIAILVCVNRDKYGAINKRRKKDND